MAFINKKTDKKSDSKNRFKKRDDKEADNKKKFDDKPAPSDEDDDSSRGKPNFKNKFKKGDDKDDDNKDRFKGRDDKDDDDEDDDDKDRFGKKKKKSNNQDVTKDPDRAGDDDDTGPSDDVDKKRGDRDDDEDEDEKGKKSKGGCNCGRQIEVNPPLRTQYEAIEALPPSLQADAVAALAEQETEKILSALAEKAEDHGVDFDILFEVFRRGWMGSPRGWSHLTEAEIGFNRVNSFLAGGLARRLDADLQEDTIGTDNLVCDHDEPTPGEKLKSKLRKRKP